MGKCGAVSEENAKDLKKVHFVRAARTDKGVHAAGQIIACKLLMSPTLMDDINQYLPEDIRVFGFRRVVAKFHAKNTCDARIYEYCLPTYLLERQPVAQEKIDEIRNQWKIEPEPEVKAGPRIEDAYKKQQQQQQNRKRKGRRGDSEDEDGSDAGEEEEEEDDAQVPLETETDERLQQRKAFRLSQEQFAMLEDIMKKFQGTHNFHNFTTGKKPTDPASKRFIVFFKVFLFFFFF